MKLELTKEWFEANLPHDAVEVGAGSSTQPDQPNNTKEPNAPQQPDLAKSGKIGSTE